MSIRYIALVTVFILGAPHLVIAGTATLGDSCADSGDCISGLVCDGSGTCQVFGGSSSGGGFGTGGGSQSGGSGTGNPGTTLVNPLGSGVTLNSFLVSILAFVIRIGSVVVILMLVYVGYLFVVARGNPTKIEEARRAFLWTVVGSLILLGAQAIAMAIQATVQAISTGP